MSGVSNSGCFCAAAVAAVAAAAPSLPFLEGVSFIAYLARSESIERSGQNILKYVTPRWSFTTPASSIDALAGPHVLAHHGVATRTTSEDDTLRYEASEEVGQ